MKCFVALGRQACLMHQATPAFFGDVMIDQRRRAMPAVLCGSAALFLPMLASCPS
jgi:hypothetical protein